LSSEEVQATGNVHRKFSNLVKFENMVFEMQEQTDIPTDTLITVVHTLLQLSSEVVPDGLKKTDSQ